MDRTCGDCRFFRETEARPDGRVGKCRLEKIRGVFRDTMRACPSFARPGDDRIPSMSNSRRAPGRRSSSVPSRPMERPSVSADTVAESLQTLEAAGLKQALVDALGLGPAVPAVELGRGWPGNLELVPADGGLKSKEVELDQLFHKLVMMRDNLRVLEQKLNSRNDLVASEKLDLQARVTRCHAAVLMFGAGWVPKPGDDGVDANARAVLGRLLREVEWAGLILPPPVLGDRWRGGHVRYGAGEDIVEEPMAVFFHRLVVMRDRLLALEAMLGAHAGIAASDYNQLSGYIRRCFGTLTTFNVLFKDRADYFSSKR